MGTDYQHVLVITRELYMLCRKNTTDELSSAKRKLPLLVGDQVGRLCVVNVVPFFPKMSKLS